MYLDFKNDLIERYLQAVRFFLPKKQRHDVSRELREDLESRIEDREDELNRALSEEELSRLLRDTGHPMLLALGYQEERSLISARTFPLYWFSLKALLVILAIVHILIPAIFALVSRQPVGAIVDSVLRFPAAALPVLAWATLLFVVLDLPFVRNQIERALANWKPQGLPGLVNEEEPKPPWLVEIALGALFGTWWLVGLQHPKILIGSAAKYVAFGDIFYTLYFPMVVAVVVSVLIGWLRWRYPTHTRALWAGDLASEVLDLVILYLLFQGGGEWIVEREPFLEVSNHARLIELINGAVGLGLGIAILASAATGAWEYLRPSAWPWRRELSLPETTGQGDERS